MQTYPQRVRENILPLSLAGNLPEAFSEWYFTGHTEDFHTPTEICELCDHDDLRYHFEIRNQFTGHSLNVGSQCILRFEVPVYATDGSILSAADAQKLLNQCVKKMRLGACISALEQLARQENNQILVNALEYYRRNKKLTPKQAFVVFWKLRDHQIDHHPSFFSISLKRKRYVEDLRSMPTSRVHFFWHALTSPQRAKAEELGHKPPQ